MTKRFDPALDTMFCLLVVTVRGKLRTRQKGNLYPSQRHFYKMTGGASAGRGGRWTRFVAVGQDAEAEVQLGKDLSGLSQVECPSIRKWSDVKAGRS